MPCVSKTGLEKGQQIPLGYQQWRAQGEQVFPRDSAEAREDLLTLYGLWFIPRTEGRSQAALPTLEE